MKYVVDIEPSPQEIAELFWNMTSEKQAIFFNHLALLGSEANFPLQIHHIIRERGLEEGGRRVMATIGEVCKLEAQPRKRDLLRDQ